MKNMQGQQHLLQGQHTYARSTYVHMQGQQHHIIAEEKIEDATMCARRTEMKDPQVAISNLILK